MNLKANRDLAKCQKAEITKKIVKCSSRKPRDNRRTSDDISAVIYFLCEFRPGNIIKFEGEKASFAHKANQTFFVHHDFSDQFRNYLSFLSKIVTRCMIRDAGCTFQNHKHVILFF